MFFILSFVCLLAKLTITITNETCWALPLRIKSQLTQPMPTQRLYLKSVERHYVGDRADFCDF